MIRLAGQGGYAGEYTVASAIPCVVGTLAERDFYYAAATADPAAPEDPGRNLGLTLTMPDTDVATAGTAAFRLLVVFGDPRLGVGYAIDTTTDPNAPAGSGVATLTLDPDGGASVRFTGQAAPLPGGALQHPVSISGIIGCSQVVRLRP